MADVEMLSSDDEDIAVTGLVATRARRSNAGNLMASLLANVDNDVELQAALAEGDDDAEGDDAASYAGSNASDVELEDSDDDEDSGPPAEGDPEDLAGERELRKAERKEQVKKRKAQDARLKLPAWTKKPKKVKLADDAKTEDGASAHTTAGGHARDRPKKKSERSNWLPSAADAPIRQSARASAVQMREVTHANLRESAARSEKQRQLMKNAAEREDVKRKRIELTKEQRLEACRKIEKETSRELGRYEREEAERQRQREAILAAKRKRGLDGAFIRHWSGSGIYEGYGQEWKLKVKRIKPARVVEEVEDQIDVDEQKSLVSNSAAPVSWDVYPLPSVVAHSQRYFGLQDGASSSTDQPYPSSPKMTFLEGIEGYAVQQKANPQQPSPSFAVDTSEPPESATNQAVKETEQESQQYQPFSYPPPLAPFTPRPSATQASTTNDWPPGASVFSSKPSKKPPLPSDGQEGKPTEPKSPPPILQEQAQRSLILLENFTNLVADTSERKKPTSRSKLAAATAAAAASSELADKIRQILLPNSIPQLTPEQHRYISTTRTFKGHRTQSNALSPPATFCCVTQFGARYKDPKTGLPYFDMHAYKTIQRVLAGGVMWSGILGAWCGARYGSMGRPARGVPEGFSLIPATKPIPAAVKTEVTE